MEAVFQKKLDQAAESIRELGQIIKIHASVTARDKACSALQSLDRQRPLYITK
jgi:hypothetical protein